MCTWVTACLFVVGASLFYSCDPVKRVERLKAKVCPLCDTTESKTIVQHDTSYVRDTIISFPDISSPEPVFDTKLCDFPKKIVRADGYTIEIWLTDGKIFHRLRDIKTKVYGYQVGKVITIKQKKHVPVYIEKEVKHIPDAFLVSAWILWVAAAGGIVYLVFKKFPGMFYWIGILIYKFTSLFKKKEK